MPALVRSLSPTGPSAGLERADHAHVTEHGSPSLAPKPSSLSGAGGTLDALAMLNRSRPNSPNGSKASTSQAPTVRPESASRVLSEPDDAASSRRAPSLEENGIRLTVLSRLDSQSINVQNGRAAVGLERDQQLRTPEAGNVPRFGEAFTARILGAAPVQAVSAVANLVVGVASSAVTRSSIPTGIAKSTIETGLRFVAESAMHVGITAAVETPPVQRMLDGLHIEHGTKEDALNRIKAVSALLTFANGTIGQVAYTAVASEILKQKPTGADFASSLIGSLVAAGVVSASVLILYRTNPAFRAQFDKQYEQLKGLLRPHANGPNGTEVPTPPV